MLRVVGFFFFFSSRRRHTRLVSDWSSDVCSSDLNVEALGVHVYHDMRQGLKDVDVVMMLRLQNERMQGALLASAQEFFKYYGLTEDKLALAKPDAIVLHPGP